MSTTVTDETPGQITGQIAGTDVPTLPAPDGFRGQHFAGDHFAHVAGGNAGGRNNNNNIHYGAEESLKVQAKRALQSASKMDKREVLLAQKLLLDLEDELIELKNITALLSVAVDKRDKENKGLPLVVG